MAILRFKDLYRDQIIDGSKTQTLRAKIPAGIRVGEQAQAASSYSRPPWARLRIDAIEAVALDDIDDRIAQADGFSSAADLLDVLHRLYAGVESFYAIRFSCIQAGAQTPRQPDQV